MAWRQLSNSCPFDVPELYSSGADYDAWAEQVWAEQVWAEIGDYDAYGPFASRDDEQGPFYDGKHG